MKLLKDRIMTEGRALSDTVLKVDGFLNHQVDPELMQAVGVDFYNHFKDYGITRVLTIESSGIAPAVYTAQAMKVPMVILKKQTSKILDGQVFQTNITSFTKGTSYELTLSKNYIHRDDKVLIIDDFLANGAALHGLISLVRQAGATVVGAGIAIEKAFQPGGELIRSEGVDLESYRPKARISRLGEGIIEFLE